MCMKRHSELLFQNSNIPHILPMQQNIIQHLIITLQITMKIYGSKVKRTGYILSSFKLQLNFNAEKSYRLYSSTPHRYSTGFDEIM